VIAIVPFCGGLVASVYNIVLNCMGIARAHEIDTGKAVMAVLLPLVVCCVAAGLLGLVIGGSLMSIFSHAR